MSALSPISPNVIGDNKNGYGVDITHEFSTKAPPSFTSPMKQKWEKDASSPRVCDTVTLEDSENRVNMANQRRDDVIATKMAKAHKESKTPIVLAREEEEKAALKRQLEAKHEVAENMANLTLIQKAARAAQMGTSKANEVKESLEAERAATKAALDRRMAEAAARKEEAEAATVAKMAAMSSSKAAEIKASEAAAAAVKQKNSEKRVAEANARAEAAKAAKAERAMQMSSKANPSFREQEKKAEEEAAARIAQKMADAEARRQTVEAEKVARMQVLSSPGPKGKRTRPTASTTASEQGSASDTTSETAMTNSMPTTLSGLVVSVASYVFALVLQIFKSVVGGNNPKED